LDETYRRILDTIPDEHKSYAVRILQFLTFSERPLSVNEIVDIIAVNTDGDPYFDPSDRMPDHQEISRYCSSLVVVVSTESDDVLQLAHFSVKEYLTSNRAESVVAPEFQKATASVSIARVCLAYLLQFDHEINPTRVILDFPLAKYSATFWMSYATVGNGAEESLMGLIERFFCFLGGPYNVCYSLHRPDQPWDENPGERNRMSASPLYYVAFGGLQKTVELLLEKNADVNEQGGFYGNALQAASYAGHDQIVKLLLERNADINAQGGFYGNALQAASHGGHEQVVKLLLERNADVNAQGGFYGNALQAASYAGHNQIVKLLLERNADINAQGGFYGNALQAASHGGHEQVVKLLLEKNADVNAQGGEYGNALQAASHGGHEQVVKLLLERNADVNAQGGFYGNALQAASYAGHDQIVKLLLERNADINARSGCYGNAMQVAAYRGHTEVLELLTTRGSISQLQDYYGRTLLWWAAAGGKTTTVEAILNHHNISPQTADNLGRKPSWIAAKKGYDALSKFLQAYKGEPNTGQRAPYDWSNNEPGLNQPSRECDVCTSSIPRTVSYYHCNLCAGGDWDVCEDCRKCGATCPEASHILVKRMMLDGA
jgi:ankyrin repeat protein